MAVIEVSDLKKSYGGLQAVSGVSFAVAKGEIFGMLGPNGAGKTTTVEIIEGLRARDGGRVNVFGLDPSKAGPEIKGRIGVQLQQVALYPRLRVREVICLFASFYERQANPDELISLLGLEERRNARVGELSGGQAQRLSVALAVVNVPELLFLDEPSTGMDPQARRNLWDVIRGFKADGMTIVLTTHYMEEAEVLADRVTMIDAGKIIASNTPKELISKYGGKKSIIVRNVKEEQYAIIKSTFKNCILDNKKNLHINYQKNTDLTKFMEFLTTNKIQFEEMELKKPNLEDAFLNLIGSKINEEGTLY